VTGQIFISLLNPGIGAVLASAFLLLWLNQRDQPYVLAAAGSYAASALGFFLQDVGPGLPMDLQRIPANLMFLLAGCLLAAAVLGRYRLAVPVRLLAGFTAAGMAGLLWFLLVDPSITNRIYSVSFALAGISLTMAVLLWRLPQPRLMDRLLFWLTLLAGLNFLLRPAIIFAAIGTIGSYDSMQQSFYWSTVQFSQAMVSITFALTLLVAVASDLIAELKQQAHTDKLSGLLNRRGFEEQANVALAHCASNGRPVALLVADLDHFKRVNDTWGHAVGDSVISLFGNMLARAAGPDMVTGRIGGEEFAVLMPGTDLAVARLFAERVRAEIAVHGAGVLPSGLEPTVSLGVHGSTGAASLYELLSSADLALYEAKRSGRNRVCVFAPGLEAHRRANRG
jgi:diguanylate cyclase (GGDEF)-like protein